MARKDCGGAAGHRCVPAGRNDYEVSTAIVVGAVESSLFDAIKAVTPDADLNLQPHRFGIQPIRHRTSQR